MGVNVVDGHCTREIPRICVLNFLEHVRILGMCAGKTGQLKRRSPGCELHSHAHAFVLLLDHFRTPTAVAEVCQDWPSPNQKALHSYRSCSSQVKAFSCSRMGILQAVPLLANPVPCCNFSFVGFPPLAQRTIHWVFCLCTCRFSTLLFRKIIRQLFFSS